VQHGVDGYREECQVSEPAASAAREDLSNSPHLIGRERALLSNLNAFVPGPPFGRLPFRHRLFAPMSGLCQSREETRPSD
jgi:hypothetical protein